MAGRIRDADVVLVRERARIDEVIGERLQLRPAGGGRLKGLCPFHDEKSPSFNVNPSLGFYHCFGCTASGDVITFLRESEHVSFVEAVEMLAGRYGIQLTYEQGSAAPGRQSSQRTRLVEANRAATAFFTEQLAGPGAGAARAFLAERGFDRTAAATYGLGFAPEGWDLLVRHLRGKGFSAEELLAAGLASQGRQGPIDRFRNRLVWPIRDLTGEVVGFGARKLSSDPGDDSPKYLNTPETPLYKKSSVLYGLEAAKKEIARRRQAVVVEGYTDVMACHLAGVPTAVATCGTAFGSDHIAVLRRLLMDSGELRGEVVFLFDGDEAGQKAALKAFDSEQEFVAQTFIAVSPGGSDPCELRLAHGDSAVRDLVASRVPLVEFALAPDAGALRPGDGRGPGGARSRHRAAGRQDQGPGAAPGVRAAPRRLARHGGRGRRAAGGRADRGGARAPAAPVPPRPSADAAALAVEREAVKLAVQLPVVAGRCSTASTRRVHRPRAARRTRPGGQGRWRDEQRRWRGLGDRAARDAPTTTRCAPWSRCWPWSRCAATPSRTSATPRRCWPGCRSSR